ncbi:hypothetical protein JHK86_019292 [Glycine max]|nr:hypothetical protein JHK86_019292 [Glycine max]
MEQWWFVVDCSNLLILHMATIFITIIIINGSTRRSHNNGLWWMMELMAAACKSTMVILTKKGKPKTDIWIAAFSSHISLNLFALVYKLNEMNGKMIGHKPLYVAVAQRKEERKALLQGNGFSVSSDLELKRKKRMKAYNMLRVEGKLKTSVRNNFKWIKNKFSDIRYENHVHKTSTIKVFEDFKLTSSGSERQRVATNVASNTEEDDCRCDEDDDAEVTWSYDRDEDATDVR